MSYPFLLYAEAFLRTSVSLISVSHKVGIVLDQYIQKFNLSDTF